LGRFHLPVFYRENGKKSSEIYGIGLEEQMIFNKKIVGIIRNISVKIGTNGRFTPLIDEDAPV
jgi:hypothetical protein